VWLVVSVAGGECRLVVSVGWLQELHGHLAMLFDKGGDGKAK